MITAWRAPPKRGHHIGPYGWTLTNEHTFPGYDWVQVWFLSVLWIRRHPKKGLKAVQHFSNSSIPATTTVPAELLVPITDAHDRLAKYRLLLSVWIALQSPLLQLWTAPAFTLLNLCKYAVANDTDEQADSMKIEYCYACIYACMYDSSSISFDWITPASNLRCEPLSMNNTWWRILWIHWRVFNASSIPK